MKLKMMYLGVRREGKTAKTAYAWLPVDGRDGDIDWNEVYHKCKIWMKQIVTGAKPGMIYEFDAEQKDERTSVTTGSEKYIGKWKNKDDIITLETMHYGEKARIDWTKKAAKDAREKVMKENLDPIRTAYWRLPAKGRAYMLAYVIQYITSGGV